MPERISPMERPQKTSIKVMPRVIFVLNLRP
jgi:hypothetical protein